MLIQKVTTGFVIQTFDTEKGKFVSQNFIASDEVEYEKEDGEPVSFELFMVNSEEAYLPFDMVQPEEN